ncbi:hypothetical protein Patl1_14165 [Pistacia atlantica]|uniref:Uncharacterized protein n=1 Tax=Pistacia atlantica TaxID=434234 RepID=A0ACC1AWC3_9ROSI|nr:hypothetical protein Patl1_14165 [Pistacia atlantica]
MARIIPQALHRHRYLKFPPSILLAQTRHHSFKAQLIEIDLDSSSSTASRGEGEADRLAIKKLEDIVQKIIVQKATPDWLPFMPGWSFWVPPQRRPNTIVDWMSKLANQLTEEETLSLTTVRGWPCSSFLLEDLGKMDIEVETLKEDGEQIEMKVEVLPDSESTSQPEDEER